MTHCGDYISVPRSAITWLKEHYPALCVKAGLCERIAGRLYTKTSRHPLEALHRTQGSFDAAADAYEAEYLQAKEQEATTTETIPPLQETADFRSRQMFLARLKNLQEKGDPYLNIDAIFGLLNDCDMLASLESETTVVPPPRP